MSSFITNVDDIWLLLQAILNEWLAAFAGNFQLKAIKVCSSILW